MTVDNVFLLDLECTINSQNLIKIVRAKTTPVVPWLSYSTLDPRFASSNPDGVDGFFSERKNFEYDFLGKGSKTVGPVP